MINELAGSISLHCASDNATIKAFTLTMGERFAGRTKRERTSFVGYIV